MVVLRKISGSTLMETMVASVLIVVIFMLSSLILNNVIINHVANDSREIQEYLNKLEYSALRNQLMLPYLDSVNGWGIRARQVMDGNELYIEFSATNSQNKLEINRKIFGSIEE